MAAEAKAVLEARHAEHLASSAIDPDIIEARGYRTVTGKPELEALEPRLSKVQQRLPGLLIPIYRLAEPEPYAYMLRPDKPRTRDGKPIKYEWPTGVAPCLDILPRYRDRLTDLTTPLLLTEGAKKADSGAGLGAYVVVNLNSVYGWRGRGKGGGKALLADFEHLALEARKVVLAFDSDFQTNRNVRQALERLAVVLQRKGAEVYMLTLPTAPDGDKTGLDDFLATIPEGQRLERLETLVKPFEGGGGMSKAYTHPVTLAPVYHPPNWHMQGEALLYTNPRTDEVTTVYPGNITVTALGYDLDAGHETATVAFTVRGERRTVTAPRQELGKARGLIELLAARGGAVHEGNARKLAAYLTEFASLNDEALPYTPHLDRLGLVPGGGLIAPGGSIGTEARYEGARALRVGTDAEAYPRALKEALAWPGEAWPLWLALGAALASPAIARLELRRSPVAYLCGPSGSGKTTVAQFAVGAWSTPGPGNAPFHIETPRSTMAGLMQPLTEAGGLPVLIDEVHTARDPRNIEATVYAFANGQSYSKGTVAGRAAGSEALRGAVLLAGEAVVEFAHAGAARRVLYLPAELYPPLGAEARSAEGKARAQVLEAAWKAGAGLLGPRVAEAIWQDWDGFTATVAELEGACPALESWAAAVAAIVASLSKMFDVLELEPPEVLDKLPDLVAAALAEAEENHDPAAVAFEAVQALVSLAKYGAGESDDPNEGRLHGELVAWREGGRWYVPTGSKAFEDRVGSKAVQLYGTAWQKQGWIEPSSNGKSTRQVRHAGAKVRVLVLEESDR